jgi:hypothetical protein
LLKNLALGVCENDPELPDLGVHQRQRQPAGPSAGGDPVNRRARVCARHLRHASNIRRTFRTSVAPAIARPGAPIDWVEWRQAVKLAQTA